MEKSLSLTVKNPEKILLNEDNLLSIRVPLIDGSLGIRPGHAPLLAELKAGKIEFKKNNNNEFEEFEIQSGILQILKNQVTIFSVDAENQNFVENEDDVDALNETLLNMLYDQFSKDEIDGS